MKKQFIILGIMLVLVTTSLVPLLTADSNVDLIAGKHMDAGDVIISNDASNIYVKFVTSDGWFLTEIHVDIASDPKDLEQTKKGNAIPGKFDYKMSFDAMDEETDYTIVIPIGSLPDNVFIAAHAVVCKETDVYVSGGLSEVIAGLPSEVTVHASHSYPGYDHSYFEVEISGDTSLDGSYDGWCIDTDHNVDTDPYDAYVHSSTAVPYLEFLEYPENLDLVNYILNQHYVGQSSPSSGVYTFGDVQLAIWNLVDDDVPLWPEALGPYDLDRVSEILADAYANGEGFVPGCDDVLAVILEPISLASTFTTRVLDPLIGQLVIIEIPIPCEYEIKCETAWGKGTDFPGNDWSMYIPYTIE